MEIEGKDQFDTAINTPGKLIVVDFTASWCPPCQMIAPRFDDLANEHKDTCLLVKVDVDENEEIAENAGISCMPTF